MRATETWGTHHNSYEVERCFNPPFFSCSSTIILPIKVLPLPGNLSIRMQTRFKKSIANTAIAALDQLLHLSSNGQTPWL